ncbi:carbohydrate kinase family protein [Membranihabitans maritimus]|uniref:carbohydrate kinase family protein n=1 Tax=Membranihabitans maritimus TaxID=2904244 RepID=UPI001F47EC80|nr:carbohydrate kinase family protein [Membranihabitans maritimus]
MKFDKAREGIICGGNWIVDHVKIIDSYPEEERLANIHREFISNGGAPYNVLKSLYLMNIGIPLEAIGMVGTDDYGRSILEECASLSINIDQMRLNSRVNTSYTDVMTVEGTGKRTFFHRRGANAFLDENCFSFSKSNAKIFHLGYLLLLDSLDQVDSDAGTKAAKVLREAKDFGLITSVDVVSEQSTRFTELIPPTLPYVDLLFINDFEVEMLTGKRILDEFGNIIVEKANQAASIIIDKGVNWAIMHFSKGAYAVSRNGNKIFQGGIKIPLEIIKGTVGAGDAFAAGVLAGIHEGWDMDKCLNLGVGVAASSLRDMTSTGSIVNWNECLRLGSIFGWYSREKSWS